MYRTIQKAIADIWLITQLTQRHLLNNLPVSGSTSTSQPLRQFIEIDTDRMKKFEAFILILNVLYAPRRDSAAKQ